MGLRSWLHALMSRRAKQREAGVPSDVAQSRAQQPEVYLAPGCPKKDWDPVPAYIPVDPQEHKTALIIAAALAAGAEPESKLVVRQVSKVNPEYKRVAIIASALAAGSQEHSLLKVKNIYKKKAEVADAA